MEVDPRLINAPKIKWTKDEETALEEYKSTYPDIPAFLIELALDYSRDFPAPRGKRITSSESRKIKKGEMKTPEDSRHISEPMKLLEECNAKWARLKQGTAHDGCNSVDIEKGAEEVMGGVKVWEGDDPDCPKYDNEGIQISGVSQPRIPDGYDADKETGTWQPCTFKSGEGHEDILPIKPKSHVKVVKGIYADKNDKT